MGGVEMKKVCPLCGTENEEDARFCKECNEPLFTQENSNYDSFIKEAKEGNKPKNISNKNLYDKTYRKVNFFSRQWFVYLWQGERPLWEAWLLLGSAVVVLTQFLFPWLVILYPNLLILFYSIVVFIQIFWWVSIWRCAQNASNLFLYISRGLVLLRILGTLTQWFT